MVCFTNDKTKHVFIQIVFSEDSSKLTDYRFKELPYYTEFRLITPGFGRIVLLKKVVTAMCINKSAKAKGLTLSITCEKFMWHTLILKANG